MTTTELIELLQKYEFGASGRSREIKIYKRKNKNIIKVLLEKDKLELYSTGDGVCGSEISLIINN
jgi:hypothetical protein